MMPGSSKQQIKVSNYFNNPILMKIQVKWVFLDLDYGKIYWPKSFGELFGFCIKAIQIFILLVTY